MTSAGKQSGCRYPPLTGDEPVSVLPASAPGGRQLLAHLGLEKVRDLWFHLPLRYEDCTRLAAIASRAGATRHRSWSRVLAVEHGFRFRPFLRVTVADADGSQLLLRFFHFNRNQPWASSPASACLLRRAGRRPGLNDPCQLPHAAR